MANRVDDPGHSGTRAGTEITVSAIDEEQDSSEDQIDVTISLLEV